VAWVNRDKLKKVLHIPKDYIIPYIITLGYPAEEPYKRPRKKLEEIIIS